MLVEPHSDYSKVASVELLPKQKAVDMFRAEIVCRIFGRIVTVGISAFCRRVGRVDENPGVAVEVRMVKFEVRNQGPAKLSSHLLT